MQSSEKYSTSSDELHQRRVIFQADQICYAVLCVFSYVAAAAQQKNQQNAKNSGAAADALQSVGSTVAAERWKVWWRIDSLPLKNVRAQWKLNFHRYLVAVGFLFVRDVRRDNDNNDDDDDDLAAGVVCDLFISSCLRYFPPPPSPLLAAPKLLLKFLAQCFQPQQLAPRRVGFIAINDYFLP